MKQLPLSQGQFTIVDDLDFNDLSQFKWYACWCPDTKSFYAQRNISINGRRSVEQMSRRILRLTHGDHRKADHFNHDTLDNRRENLRILTNRENCEHRKRKSPYGTGIFLDKRGKLKPFRVTAMVSGKVRNLGCFASAEEAQKARSEKISQMA